MTLTPRRRGFCPQKSYPLRGHAALPVTHLSPSSSTLLPTPQVSHSGCSSILPRTKTRWLKPPAGRGAVPGERQAAGLGPLCPKMVFLCPPWLLLNENFGIWGGRNITWHHSVFPFLMVFCHCIPATLPTTPLKDIKEQITPGTSILGSRSWEVIESGPGV